MFYAVQMLCLLLKVNDDVFTTWCHSSQISPVAHGRREQKAKYVFKKNLFAKLI